MSKLKPKLYKVFALRLEDKEDAYRMPGAGDPKYGPAKMCRLWMEEGDAAAAALDNEVVVEV